MLITVPSPSLGDQRTSQTSAKRKLHTLDFGDSGNLQARSETHSSPDTNPKASRAQRGRDGLTRHLRKSFHFDEGFPGKEQLNKTEQNEISIYTGICTFSQAQSLAKLTLPSRTK